ncbi:MAG: M20/M25/M40 family metallo-hydrolase [Vicinamibacterales bacterium]
MTRLAALVAALAVASPALAQSARPHVETLAADRFAGRQAGTEGERLAADYIAAQLRRAGAQPLPGQAGLLLPFEFTAGSRDGGSSVTLGVRDTFRGADVVQALSFSDDAEVSGEAVFAGYGIVVPESQNFGYDSYAALDVKDKIVVVLRYFPEDADQQTRAILARYSDLRYKAMAARQHGARALIVVTGPRSQNAGRTVPMTFDTALAGSGIPAASLGGAAVGALFAAAPKTLAAAQQELDSGNPHVAGFALPRPVTLTTRVVRERQTARNIVGYLPATVPVTGVDKPWILLGAHYDHLGLGTNGTSLASREEAGGIHNGADDNASGTAAVLALAERLAATTERRRHVIVALWSAEEIGLLGSAAFAAAQPVPMAQVAATINFDMVGRMQDNKLIAQAVGTSPAWTRLLERANIAAGFDLTVQADPYQPTDVATFNTAGVPSLSFTTGSHTDYHKPSDDAERIAYEDLDRIVGFAAAIVRGLDAAGEAPQFTKVDQPTGRGGSIAGVRVTTGTIPDYATEVKGLLLGGVVGGGPAEQAGLLKGDVIVEIAGQTIANVYDYTYALELLKADTPVKVVYLRNGERRETELTPTARR